MAVWSGLGTDVDDAVPGRQSSGTARCGGAIWFGGPADPRHDSPGGAADAGGRGREAAAPGRRLPDPGGRASPMAGYCRILRGDARRRWRGVWAAAEGSSGAGGSCRRGTRSGQRRAEWWRPAGLIFGGGVRRAAWGRRRESLAARRRTEGAQGSAHAGARASVRGARTRPGPGRACGGPGGPRWLRVDRGDVAVPGWWRATAAAARWRFGGNKWLGEAGRAWIPRRWAAALKVRGG